MSDRKRLEQLDREDIISKLPDDLLIHILSRLGTKDVVKTSVLSSRWRNLWTLIYNLYFNDYGINDFVNVVDKILKCCQSRDLQNFYLVCAIPEENDFSRVTDWVCFAIDHGVRNLAIIVDTFKRIRLPQSILTCKTLVKLQFENDFVVDIPDSVCFPSLKVLYISIVFPEIDLIQKLFRSCPVLEALSINASSLDKIDHLLRFEICMPTLRRLFIHHVLDYCYFEGVFEHKYVVTAPNLEYLCIANGALASFVVNARPLLDEVELDVGASHALIDEELLVHEDSELDNFQGLTNEANHVMELLRGIILTKRLSLSSSTLDALSMVVQDYIPTFPNLIRLELNMDTRFGYKFLVPLLQKSPNLEVLIFEMEPESNNSLKNFISYESERISSCLKLKKIEIRRVVREVEEEAVSFILTLCEVLKGIYACIDSATPGSKEDLQREILMRPRHSAAH